MPGKLTVVWFHDETIFYTHNQQQRMWFHKDVPAHPQPKGDGLSLMVADFGWLHAPNGSESEDARIILKPGKNHEGYMTSVEVEDQLRRAMDLVAKYWPDCEHIFIYDNTTTHSKHPKGSLSAFHIPKFPSKPDTNFLVEVTKRDPATRKPA